MEEEWLEKEKARKERRRAKETRERKRWERRTESGDAKGEEKYTDININEGGGVYATKCRGLEWRKWG